jgi:hypothetical protein
MLNEINGPLAVLIIMAHHVFLLRLRLGKAPPWPAGAPAVALRVPYGAGCSEDAGAETCLLMRPALDFAEFLWWAGLHGLAAELE